MHEIRPQIMSFIFSHGQLSNRTYQQVCVLYTYHTTVLVAYYKYEWINCERMQMRTFINKHL